MKTRSWTEEQRAMQATILRARAPWKRSTGPITEEGKAKVAQNSTKHGLRGGVFRQVADLLAKHHRLLKELSK